MSSSSGKMRNRSRQASIKRTSKDVGGEKKLQKMKQAVKKLDILSRIVKVEGNIEHRRGTYEADNNALERWESLIDPFGLFICAFEATGWLYWGLFRDIDTGLNVLGFDFSAPLCVMFVMAFSVVSDSFGGGIMFNVLKWLIDCALSQSSKSKSKKLPPRPIFAVEAIENWYPVFLGTAAALLLENQLAPFEKTKLWMVVNHANLGMLYVWGVTLACTFVKQVTKWGTFEKSALAPVFSFVGTVLYTGGTQWIRDPVLSWVYGRQYFVLNPWNYFILACYVPIGVWLDIHQRRMVPWMMVLTSIASFWFEVDGQQMVSSALFPSGASIVRTASSTTGKKEL